MIQHYIDCESEPELKQEFLERIKKAERGKFVQIKNFAKHYGAE